MMKGNQKKKSLKSQQNQFAMPGMNQDAEFSGANFNDDSYMNQSGQQFLDNSFQQPSGSQPSTNITINVGGIQGQQGYPGGQQPMGQQQNNVNQPGIIQGKPVVNKGGQFVQMGDMMKGGLEKLRSLERIFVKQKFEMLEMLTGCETENRYKVYPADENMEKCGSALFKCKERSNFFARNCLSGDCRPFEMKVIHQDQDEDDDESDDMFLWLSRPCKCTCLCCNRPEISVTLKENNNDKYLGKVISQWALCDMVFDVLDRDDKLIYKIAGDCCQWGLFCNCPCEKCAKIVFYIKTPDGENVGEIFKIYSGVMKEMFTDTDNFCCIFPNKASPEEKALLLASVLFIDFRYFESSPSQNNPM